MNLKITIENGRPVIKCPHCGRNTPLDSVTCVKCGKVIRKGGKGMKLPETWKCHICGEERSDDKISVLSKPLVINGQLCGQQNIRYCNDRPACVEGAKEFSFFKEGRNETRKG